MKTLISPLSLSPPPRPLRHLPRASIRPPPPGFDYKSETLSDSRAFVSTLHPELMDLAEDGTLVVIEKRRFGPVPEWRREFVEPEVIWLVGTEHIGEKSVKDVERVVKTVRPESVVVELCRSRAGIMYASNGAEDATSLKSNMFSLSGTQFLGTVNRSINLGGQSALALRLLLAVFSSKISSGTNRLFGDDFRAARMASEDVGAQIVLGDRPIEITLKRVWSSLGWNEKSKLLVSLFRGIASPALELPKTTLKNEKMDQSASQLYEQLSITYPSLLQPLIHERDTYLAWSLKRSKAVNNSKRVVGVIGKAHMNGVVYSLITDSGDLRFSDLTGKKPGDNSKNGWVATVIKGLIRDTVLTAILWALYEQFKPYFSNLHI